MFSEEQIIQESRRMIFDEGRYSFNNFLVSVSNINSVRKLETAKRKLETFRIAVDNIVLSTENLGKEINIVNVLRDKFNSASREIKAAEKELIC